MADQSHQSDAMIARLETEQEERSAFIQGLVAGAQDSGRDLTDNETELIKSADGRNVEIRKQLDTLRTSRQSIVAGRKAIVETYSEMEQMRYTADRGPVEYRSAGAYIIDVCNAHSGVRDAKERLEMFYRVAAHQKTTDNLGLIPDPVVGPVLNFIDTARPLINFVGPQNMPSATWYRPIVTQQPTVAKQGEAGLAADEKAELVSQKMIIGRLTAVATTYGGYVNVSRQNIDFSNPQAMDVIVDGLAGQYAIATEATFGATLIATANEIELTTAVAPAVPTAAELTAALWAAVAAVFTAVKGQGRVALAVSPGKLGAWGGVFSPINPQNAQSAGFNAGDFGSGIIGNISGIPVIMSAGIAGAATDYGVVFSTAAIEAYEQRIGTLQAVEPSVLGVQVAYAGYFTPLVVAAGGLQRIVNEA